MVWTRRVVQAFFLLLFLYLVWAAIAARTGEPSRKLRFFFDLDPLVLAATWLATHALPAAAWLALVTVVATLLLGRVFCGWVCPLGTLNQIVTSLRRWLRRLRPERQSPSKGQRLKYILLVILLVMAVFGVHWVGVFDPLSILYRSVAVAVYPAAQYAIEDASTAVYQTDPKVGPLEVKSLTEPVYQFSRDTVFGRSRPAYTGGTVIALVFILILVLNLFRPRFWCRYVCPLGALLGALAKRPMVRLRNMEERCTNCGKCSQVCPAAAAPDKPGQWLPTECFACWNCVAACPTDALAFKAEAPLLRGSPAGKVDVSKRVLLASAAGGVAGLLTLRLEPQAQAKTFNPVLIRPPGARAEREFLQRCIQCGLCMQVCPTNALHPTLFEAGLEGLWTPRLVPRLGYCEYECNRCGQVCPTEALVPLPLDEKKETKIGLACIDTTRCLPYAFGEDCIVCEEHCPIPDKAIYFLPQEVTLRDGTTRIVKQPHVCPDRCIGCGICENKCPFEDMPAIRVTSANETRHEKNRPILSGRGTLKPLRTRRRLRRGRNTDAGDPYGGGF